jgi:hypothetical protein
VARSHWSAGRATWRAHPACAARSAACTIGLLSLWLALNTAIPSAAWAQDVQAFELVWDAPAECPDRAAVIALLDRQRPAGIRGPTPLKAHAQVVATRAGYRLQLQLTATSSSAHRRLTSRDCDALAQATAVLIALAFEAEPAAVDGDPSPGPERDASPTLEAPDPSQPAAAAAGNKTDLRANTSQDGGARGSNATAPTSSESHSADFGTTRADAEDEDATQSQASAAPTLGLALGAGAALDLGMLPRSPSVGLRLELGLQVGRLRTTGGWSLWLPGDVEPETYPTALLEGRAWTADLALGLEFAVATFAFTPAVAFEYGQLRVDARHIADPQQARATWIAAGAGVRAALAIVPKLEIGLQARGLVPFERPRFLVRTNVGDVTAFTSAPIALRVSLDLTYLVQ